MKKVLTVYNHCDNIKMVNELPIKTEHILLNKGDIIMLANVKLNVEKRGIEIKFDCKPEFAIITALKENGFRWSGKQKLWYAKQNDERLSFAETIGTVSGTMNCNENDNYNLWDMTKTDGIEDNYAKTKLHSEKEIAKIIRNHIKSRFPMCKWSVTSGRLNISVRLLSSPFAKESDELKAIKKYVMAFAESYNYNNSDIMSDYFDVNFYGTYSIPCWDYEQREATDEEIKISEMFAENKAEYDKAEELRQQKEYEEFQLDWKNKASDRYITFIDRLSKMLGFYPTKVTKITNTEKLKSAF